MHDDAVIGAAGYDVSLESDLLIGEDRWKDCGLLRN